MFCNLIRLQSSADHPPTRTHPAIWGVHSSKDAGHSQEAIKSANGESRDCEEDALVNAEDRWEQASANDELRRTAQDGPRVGS